MTAVHSLIVFFSFVVLLVLIAVLYTIFYNSKLIKIDSNQIMEFKSSMDLCDLPVITFYQGKNKYNFLIDTGSNVSYINKSSNILVTKLDGEKDSFIGASGNSADCDLGNLNLYFRDKEYECTVRIADLDLAFNNVAKSTGVNLTGIIGNDFMQEYKYCIDFKEFVVYARK